MRYIKAKTVNKILLKSIKEITDFAKEENKYCILNKKLKASNGERFTLINY